MRSIGHLPKMIWKSTMASTARLCPSLPTTRIMPGWAIATSKSVIPPSTSAARSSAPTCSAPASRAASAVDAAAERVDLMTPIVKGWSTELANEICSLGIQVHGGMGFIGGTAVERMFRDARINSIGGGATEVMLEEVAKRLEDHYADMLDLEFTVEDGELFMLQTRRGKRTAAAAVKVSSPGAYKYATPAPGTRTVGGNIPQPAGEPHRPRPRTGAPGGAD